MAALPTLEAGDNECLALATRLKGVLQDAQIWTEAHEAVFQQAVAIVSSAPPESPAPATPATPVTQTTGDGQV